MSSHPEIESVCYSGGDPVLYSGINEVMAFHIRHNIKFGLITAGYFPNADLGLLAEARWVRVSLDSVTPSIYDECRGGISVNKVIDSILQAKVQSVNIELNITVSEKTVPGLNRLFEFALINQLNLELHPIYGGSIRKLGIDDLLHEYANAFSKKGIPFDVICYNDSQPTNKCKAVYYQSFIDAKGDIYPCCMMAGDTTDSPQGPKVGNIFHWGEYLEAREIFSNLTAEELPKMCSTCPERLRLINNTIGSDSRHYTKSFF